MCPRYWTILMCGSGALDAVSAPTLDFLVSLRKTLTVNFIISQHSPVYALVGFSIYAVLRSIQ